MLSLKSLDSIFSVLNQKTTYLVLRNYEGFYDSVLLDNHADIDILCDIKDKKKLIDLLVAEPRFDKNDGIHYRFQVSSGWIPIDIRSVGDGYYDLNWEKNMLKNRELDSRGFYHMSSEDYFWSLLYHALYHKGNISDEYYDRLAQLKPHLFPASKEQLMEQLDVYMRTNEYYYTIAKDKYLWYHFSDLCNGRIKAYPFYKAKKFAAKCREYAYRTILRRKVNANK